ncbi:hypothetical protein [Salipiger mangrovisoli]|uniref:hypothetical protein n=1 Tax=Salipiger mangrovisoli TaxID=2865933 RepID=UPI00187E5FC1|nr:hypothetical protein [Salipiger mangrovisoli]
MIGSGREDAPAAVSGGGDILIPALDTSPDESACDDLRGRGMRLARQERWSTLDSTLREADLARSRTPGGMLSSRLLCEGAVEDVVARAAEAVALGDPAAARMAVLGFGGALGPTIESPMRALLAASAHIAVARLWREAGISPLPEPQRRAAVQQHLETAHLVLRPHDPEELGSAALAAARCAVLEVLPAPASHVARSYKTLFKADPGGTEHQRAFGLDLSPARFGTWSRLDRAARGMVARGGAHRGCAAYTWVWLDVLAQQPEGFGHVDAELFVEGMHDILRPGSGRPRDCRPDQHLANLLAAWCSRHTSARPEPCRQPGDPARARIGGCLGWIVTDQLRELHPLLWAATDGARHVPETERSAIRTRGTEAARAALRGVLAHQLDRGRRVIFTEDGLGLQPDGRGSCTLAPCAALAYPRRNLRDEDPPCLT